MIAASGLRWVLSLMFAVPVLYGVWRIALPGTRMTERVDHALHASMGVLMIAMAWPWGMDVPSAPQVVLFSAGALWFVMTALFRAGDRSWGKAELAALPHVVMMGAMAWMVAAMPSSGGVSGHSTGGGMHDMAGMDMSAGSGVATMSLTGTGPRMTAALLAVALGALGLAWLTRALDRAREGDSSEGLEGTDAVAGQARANLGGALAPACHAGMALGMAVMFVLLV